MVGAAAASAVAPVGAWLCWLWRSLSIIVEGCDDLILLILFIHPATVHLLQLPEGSTVQARACQHDQEVVSQYPLVVCLDAASTLVPDASHRETGPSIVQWEVPRSCVFDEQARDRLWFLETLGELIVVIVLGALLQVEHLACFTQP